MNIVKLSHQKPIISRCRTRLLPSNKSRYSVSIGDRNYLQSTATGARHRHRYRRMHRQICRHSQTHLFYCRKISKSDGVRIKRKWNGTWNLNSNFLLLSSLVCGVFPVGCSNIEDVRHIVRSLNINQTFDQTLQQSSRAVQSTV